MKATRSLIGFFAVVIPWVGYVDFESLDELAGQQGLSFRTNYSMPSNNQILVWERGSN